MVAGLVGVAAAVLLLWPFAHEARAQARIARIGVLSSDSADTSKWSLDVFRQRLGELGYVEGRNIAIEVRYGLAKPEQIREFARELASSRVDVIVASGTRDTRAATEQTSTIPIVMVHVGDAVRRGFVKSLSRPAGNVTGITMLGPEVALKGFDLLTEAVPRARRVAVLYSSGIAADPLGPSGLAAAARAKGITVEAVKIDRTDERQIRLAAMSRTRPDALHIVALSLAHHNAVAEFALKHRLPTLFGFREAVDAGALMSFGPKVSELWRSAADYVDRILKGARPGDLPVEQPTRFELIVNLKTAKAIGITIPASVLARADEVIQ